MRQGLRETEGLIIEQGAPDAIFREPQQARTRAFLRAALESR